MRHMCRLARGRGILVGWLDGYYPLAVLSKWELGLVSGFLLSGHWRGWWASVLRLALVVVLVPVIVVLDVGAADAVKVPETMSKRRPAGAGAQLARDPEAIEGDITIATNVDGKLRKVLVRLPPEPYKSACDAHTADLKVGVVGELGKEGRQYRLISPRHLRVLPADEATE